MTNKHTSLFTLHASRRLVLCALSAILLILAFPKVDAWFLAWIAFVPLLFVLDGLSARRAFKWSYLCGLVFNIGVFHWFTNMSRTAMIPAFLSWLAMFAMCAYLSLYFGLFGLFYVWSRERFSPALRLLIIPAGWVVLEWLRENLFSGFGWASLGYSQYRVLPVIQIAEVTGVLGVSFIVMAVNVAVKQTLSALVSKKRAWPEIAGPTAWAAVLILLTLAYGISALERQGILPAAPDLRVAVVQGNVRQEMKWDPYYRPQIMTRYLDLTREAAQQQPDLIIWPETSFPGYSWDSQTEFAALKKFVAGMKVPLLLGMITRQEQDYFNSALFLSDQGILTGQYDKRHLVPFGEYLPLRQQLPFLSYVVPIEDFTAGSEIAAFTVPAPGRSQQGDSPFSVLICFEDTVARVARAAVNNGAVWLVNMTNDAWFLDSKEPYLHLQAAVLRCVENRRDMVRAANTGISCSIDSRGVIRDILSNNEGDPTYVDGVLSARVTFHRQRTFYTKCGDVFTYLCLGGILMAVLFFKKTPLGSVDGSS